MSVLSKSKRKTNLPLIVGAIPFLITGFDALAQKDILFGAANLMMGFANLIALRLVDKSPAISNAGLFILNSAMSFFVSYKYYLDHKKGLPYAWIMIGLGYIVAAIVVYNKLKRKNDDSTSKTPARTTHGL